MNRKYEIEDFLANQCWRVTGASLISKAMREVLTRLPENVLDTLIYDRNLCVIFPERYANTIYRNDVPIAYNRSDNKELPKFTMREMWYVVLADYLYDIDYKAIVGTIVHEFAHVYLEHFGFNSEVSAEYEAATDKLASEWGFLDEIKKSRHCHNIPPMTST